MRPVLMMNELDDVSWEFFKALKQNIDDMAELHVNANIEKYKDKDETVLRIEVYMNHDYSVEVERVERIIDAAVSPTELKCLQMLFCRVVLDKLRWRAENVPS